MQCPSGISRVVIVVLDGLRADAIPLHRPPHLTALLEQSAFTLTARTVAPSVTAAALASLLTGVSPRVHGFRSDRLALPRQTGRITPLSACLRAAGIPTFGFKAALPWGFRGIARQIVRGLGADVLFAGTGAAEILDRSLPSLERERSGLWICHWPDADLAGHAAGWTSPAYLRAVHRFDQAIGRLVYETGVTRDPGTVLIVLADHGGGGAVARNHDSDHPIDTAIPLIIAGGRIARGELAPPCSILDVPATIPWLLGVPTPEGYEGRILAEAIARPAVAAELGVAA